MDGLIGVAFKDFVLLAADKTMTHSILAVKHDQKKIHKLSDHLMMGVVGEPGDTLQFAEFIEKNIQLYKMRNGFELAPASAANFIQRNLSDSLRSRSPYQVNCLIAGFSEKTGGELYFLDYLGTMSRMPFALHGYAGYISTSVFDRWYREDATLDEAVSLLTKAIAEVQRRLIINMPVFSVVLLDKNGIKHLSDVRIKTEALGI